MDGARVGSQEMEGRGVVESGWRLSHWEREGGNLLALRSRAVQGRGSKVLTLWCGVRVGG